MQLTVSWYGALTMGGGNNADYNAKVFADARDLRNAGFSGAEIWFNGNFMPSSFWLARADGTINSSMMGRFFSLRLAMNVYGSMWVGVRVDNRLFNSETAQRNFWTAFGTEMKWKKTAMIVDVSNEALGRTNAANVAACLDNFQAATAGGSLAAKSSCSTPSYAYADQRAFMNSVISAGGSPEILLYHGPRGASFASAELTFTQQAVAGAGGLQYYAHEPMRRGYQNIYPPASEFYAAARNARLGGAVRWCFHNGAKGSNPGSFDMSNTGKRLITSFDSVELEIFNNIVARAHT